MVLSQDQLKFIFGLFISIPLSYLLRNLKSTQSRYLFSFLSGLLLQLYVYGWDVWIPFVAHLSVYLMIKIKGRKCGALVTGVTILTLSIYHVYRLIDDYGSWTLDITTILMPMICKYSLFAYAYQDGAKNKQTDENKNDGSKPDVMTTLPSLYEYLVYCLFLPTCIIGTATQYKDFHSFMQMQSPFSGIARSLILKKILSQFVYSFICASIYLLHVFVYPLSTMKSQSFFLQSPLYILYYSYMCVTFIKFKYYFGWKLSMCAVHASGISYSGEDKFDRVKTCDPWKVETTYHLRDKISNWNMSSELWLRKCIYQRSPFKNKQIGQAYTFVISSFWHGFYGGYYLSFGLWFLQINLATKVFKFIQLNPNHLLVNLFTWLGFMGKVIIWILVNFFFSHNGLYFQILDSYLGLLIMKRLYFMPLLIILGSIWYFGRGKKQKRERKEVKQEEEDRTATAAAANPEKSQ